MREDAKGKVRVSFSVDPDIRKAIDGVCAIRNCSVADLLDAMSVKDVVAEYQRLHQLLK